ncbi:MAG: penicillin-binding protein activator LpoB [bacterium]
MREAFARRWMILALSCLLAAAAGCSSKTVYVSPGDPTQLGPSFSDTDMRAMAQSMYSSLQARLVAIRGADAPAAIVALLRIGNKTAEHIDTDMISDKLQIELLRAGSLRFVDRSRIRDMSAEFDLAAGGLIDPAKAKSAGKALGADYFLYGELGSITKSEGRITINYYRLSMKLTDIETNEVLWAEDFETKKMETKPGIGW